jgi:hypothetical protein
MKWIREHYRVPAKRGMQVIVRGRHGIIVGSMRGYLRIKLCNNPKPLLFHPTSGIYYCQKQTIPKTFNQEFLTLHLAYQDLKAECFKVVKKPLQKVCDFLEDTMRILRGLKK